MFAGAFSRRDTCLRRGLFPPLDPAHAAQAIVAACQSNADVRACTVFAGRAHWPAHLRGLGLTCCPQEVVLPKISGCMLRLVNILPTWLRDPLYGYMGGWYGMQGFTGHNVQAAGSSRPLDPSDELQASHLSSKLDLPGSASTPQPRRRVAAAAAAGAAATNASPYCEL